MNNVNSPRLILGIGGTARPGSSSELALRACLDHASSLGARTEIFCSADLELPIYSGGALSLQAQRLVDALRRCDGLVISSPSYHGALSGALKNALDYAEELRGDRRPYLDGRAVGIIVCAYGAQAIGTTLMGIRSIVHALRGWPTPMGAGINSSGKVFGEDGQCIDPASREQLHLVAQQVCDFATMRQLLDSQRGDRSGA